MTTTAKSFEQLPADYQQRFGGVARLYGEGNLLRLATSCFLVAGIGGVGSWTAEALARSGVGNIVLLDLDDICITNTNRQIHTVHDTIGQEKTQVMADRLRTINPGINVDCVNDFLDEENPASLIGEHVNCVIDAIDNAQAKAALIAYCKRRKLPLITVGSAGGKLDPRQLTSGDLSKTVNDPLLAKVRNILRRDYRFSRNPKRRFSIEAVYSTEQMTYPAGDGSVCQQKPDNMDGVKLDCSGGFGAISMVTATAGFIAASRAIERFLQKQHNLTTA